MPQKPLRTMQDDIKEAQEKLKRPVFGFSKKNKNNDQQKSTKKAEEETEGKTEANTEIKEQPIEKNISTSFNREPVLDTNKKEGDKPTNFEDVIDRNPENIKDQAPKPRNFENIIKKDINNINRARKQKGEAEILEIVTDNEKEKNRLSENKRKELEDLTKRISSSLKAENTNTQTQKTPDSQPQPIKKDDELKNLINRISEDFKKNNETKQKEVEETSNTEEIKEETLLKNTDNINKREEIQNKRIPYWSKLQKDLKKEKIDPNKIPVEANVIKDSLKKTEDEKVKTPDVIKEEEEKAKEGGLITPKIEKKVETENKEEETKKKISVPKFDSGYISPENRLVFGKQEYYSSIHKKVKPKTKKDSLDQFKEIMETNEDYKTITEEEEKKMLKKQIFKKYSIKLSFLPWKKIIIGSIVFFALLGGTLFYVLPLLRQDPDPIQTTIAEGKNIDFVEQKIPLEVVTTESQFKIINYFDGNSAPWSNFYDGQIIKIKITREDNTLIPIDEALISILGEDNFNNIPENFKNSITEEYNILVFKDRDNMRLGLVFKFDETKEINPQQEMFDWENTSNSKQEIKNITEELFLDSKVSEEEMKQFKSADYQDIEIRYLNLPDSDTSIDYFIYNNLVFFTTSQETTSNLIDIIK